MTIVLEKSVVDKSFKSAFVLDTPPYTMSVSSNGVPATSFATAF